MTRRIDPASWQPVPWKNGGGIMYELARWPETGEPDIRISLAEVERAGPFSFFPGCRRWSFLVGTAPIELAVGDVTHRLVAPGDHIELPGEVAITAHLPAGPTRLFNVLARVALQVGRGPTRHPVRFALEMPSLVGHVEVPAAPAGSIWVG